MRRSPLHRRAPLKRGGRIKPRSAKRDAIAEERREFVAAILRARPWCEACVIVQEHHPEVHRRACGRRSLLGEYESVDVHEIVRRSQGSPIVPSKGLTAADVLAVYRRCHSWISTNPADAVALGLARWGMRANPVVSRLSSTGSRPLTEGDPRMAETLYRGTVTPVPGLVGDRNVVRVRLDDQGVQIGLAHLQHRAFRSAEMTWGHADGRSFDLARALLIDALGDRAICATCDGTGHVVFAAGTDKFRAAKPGEEGEFVKVCHDCISTGFGDIVEAVFESFRNDVVARWAADEGWEISRAEIVAYAEQRMAELGTRA